MFRSRPARKVRAYRPRLELLEDRTLLSTYLVDRMTDTGAGSGLAGDLRYAITHAVDGDAITFGVNGTINLTGALPDLAHNISINGPGANLLTVRRDTGGNYRIFTVGATVSISGLTIANGLSSSFRSGGGISNQGSLTLSNRTVSQNLGIGIVNSGTLTLTSATVSDNGGYEQPSGGGIYNHGGSMTVSNCTVTHNDSGEDVDGGGILNDHSGTATLNNCTITNNIGGNGGGVANEALATMTIANSTISGNTALGHAYDTFGGEAYGGGIYNGPDLDGGSVGPGRSNLVVTNSTITGNVAVFDYLERFANARHTHSDPGTIPRCRWE